MLEQRQYKDARSRIEITFLDGEVRQYEISAGAGLSKYLANQAAECGILCFIDYQQKASLSIPVANIREWSLQELPTEFEE